MPAPIHVAGLMLGLPAVGVHHAGTPAVMNQHHGTAAWAWTCRSRLPVLVTPDGRGHGASVAEVRALPLPSLRGSFREASHESPPGLRAGQVEYDPVSCDDADGNPLTAPGAPTRRHGPRF